MAKAKPFIKWAGGKGQLISQLEALLPDNLSRRHNLTYIEPFVGGGAMLFHMLQSHRNITRAIINDINPDLTGCYATIRDNAKALISQLADYQRLYHSLTDENSRKEFYLTCRKKFNGKGLGQVENSALFIFLNRTCFNGLYRVNKSGEFNVPFGKAVAPTICDEATIMADSELLQRVEILTGDFEEVFGYVTPECFVYFDPPYRPLSTTSYFNDYAKEAFNDDSQIRLKHFCDRLHQAGVSFMLSNSDSRSSNPDDMFFDNLYSDYSINRVLASRMINSNAAKRGKLSEIVVSNYPHTPPANLFSSL